MCSAKSYIKDTGDFLNKFKELVSVPQNALLVAVDVVALYPSIPHQSDFECIVYKVRATRR